MASYRAVPGVFAAIRDFLELRMADDLNAFITNPGVSILGSRDLIADPVGNQLGLYLHRISVDPFGRNRYLKSAQANIQPQPELPINLHFLLMAWTDAGDNEGTLVSWGMQHIGSSLNLDISHLGAADSRWSDSEVVQVIPEDMSTEDLLRIWDGLPRDYVLSTPYIAKTLRLLPVPEIASGPPVRTVAIPAGVLE